VLAEFAGNAVEEFAQVIFGVVQRLRAHAKGGRDAAPNSSAFGEEHLSAAHLSLRTKPKPGCES
jgi:hypothetical protein